MSFYFYLRNILPKRYNQLFLDVSHKSLNPKQNIQKLTEVLENDKDQTLNDLKTAGERKKQYEYESSPGFKRENSESKRENFNLVGERRHDCRTSKECNQDWDKLGCIKLYKLEKADDRIELMKSVSCWGGVDT